jgi:alpha-1,2-mannosyltransferase
MTIRTRTTRERSLPRGLPPVVTGLLVLLAAAYLARWARHDGLDLQVYRAGISSWRAGHNPYDRTFTAHHLEFTYPPFALVFLSPLAWTSSFVTQVALWTASVLALTVSVYVVCLQAGGKEGWRLASNAFGWVAFASIVFEPVRSTLDYGQINAVLLCLVVVDLFVVPRRHRGWLIGLAAATKLTPLVFLALPLLERDWKTVVRGVGAALGATGLVWLVSPGVARTYWTADVFAARRAGNVGYVGNQSLYGLLHRWPFPSTGQPYLWAVLAGAVTLLGLYVARQCLRDGRRVAAMLALAFVGLLVSPISWTHHFVWIVLLPPFLVAGGARTLHRGTNAVLCFLCAVAVLAPYWWFSAGVPADVFDDTLGLSALVVLAVWCCDEHRARASSITTVDDVSVADIG